MQTDIYRYIKTKWPDQMELFLNRIRAWDEETRGLLGDRIVRSTLYLAADFEEFDGWIAEAKDNWRRVLAMAEEEGLRDFNKPFKSTDGPRQSD